MSIRNVLLEIRRLAKENGLSEPCIVGGLPRDKMLNKLKNIADVDITSGDDSVHKLALLASQNFRVNPIRFEDGHTQMYIEKVKYDFSSNFNSPYVERLLNKAGVPNPEPMQKELFSRDFTCNTLIITPDLRRIKDPTGMGIPDIRNKIIKTPLPPRFTLKDDPRRVIRAIYLAAKLGFSVEEDVIRWARSNKKLIKEKTKPGYSRNKLASAAKYDIKNTISLLTKMDLWDVVAIPLVITRQVGHRGAP